MSKSEPALPNFSWDEGDVPGGDSERKQALRLLARWLISAARKGAPGAALSQGGGLQNSLDVARDTEVVSKER